MTLATDNPVLDRVVALLRDLQGVDFGGHTASTLTRRVQWRAALCGLSDLPAYARFLAGNPAEQLALRSALLVQVTQFWRDPPMWEALHDKVLPTLGYASRREGRGLRAWSAGCADGRETWTLASLLWASAADGWLVVGSDLDPTAVQFAQDGVYAASALGELPELLGPRTLDLKGAYVQVKPGLRPAVRFCVHDLAGVQIAPEAAVVARFDLVLCRNVLIYLQPQVREVVLRKLAAVLPAGGVLVLGLSESLHGEATRWFEPLVEVSRQLRMYRRTQEAL